MPAPVSQRELEAEAKAKGYGSLYAAFGGGIPGLRACAAADALVEINAIDTLLSNFIVPLQVGRPVPSQSMPFCCSACFPLPPCQPRGAPASISFFSPRWSLRPLQDLMSTPSSRGTPLRRLTSGCTAPSTSTRRRGGYLPVDPTSRTSRRLRRTDTRWASKHGVEGRVRRKAGEGWRGGQRGRIHARPPHPFRLALQPLSRHRRVSSLLFLRIPRQRHISQRCAVFLLFFFDSLSPLPPPGALPLHLNPLSLSPSCL